MLALGLQGSPNSRGSSDYLLNRFMTEMAARGVRTLTIDVAKKNIRPCKGCGYCEKKGFCIIDDDDMAAEIYALLREARIIVAASPVFFYGVTSQLKALIDRTQALWSRKYRFKLSDPLKKTRQGFLLSLGGSRGQQLFDGVLLTAKYFFDAVDAEFCGSLTYRNIETRKDIMQHATVSTDIDHAVESILSPLKQRKKIIFAGRENACRSQMAGAFAQQMGGNRLDIMTGGIIPASRIDKMMLQVMAEKGMDLAFSAPAPLEKVVAEHAPELIIAMDRDPAYPFFPGIKIITWDLPDSIPESAEQMNRLRDQIEKNVETLLENEQLLHHENKKV